MRGHEPGQRLAFDLDVVEVPAELEGLEEHAVDLLVGAAPTRPVGLRQDHREGAAVATTPRHRDRRVALERRPARLATKLECAREAAERAGAQLGVVRRERGDRFVEQLDRARRRGSPGASTPPRSRSPRARGARRPPASAPARRCARTRRARRPHGRRDGRRRRAGASPARARAGRGRRARGRCGTDPRPRRRRAPARPTRPRAGCTRRHARLRRPARLPRSGARGRRGLPGCRCSTIRAPGPRRPGGGSRPGARPRAGRRPLGGRARARTGTRARARLLDEKPAPHGLVDRVEQRALEHDRRPCARCRARSRRPSRLRARGSRSSRGEPREPLVDDLPHRRRHPELGRGPERRRAACGRSRPRRSRPARARAR